LRITLRIYEVFLERSEKNMEKKGTKRTRYSILYTPNHSKITQRGGRLQGAKRISPNVPVYEIFCVAIAEQNLDGGFCIKAVTRYTPLADVFLFFLFLSENLF